MLKKIILEDKFSELIQALQFHVHCSVVPITLFGCMKNKTEFRSWRTQQYASTSREGVEATWKKTVFPWNFSVSLQLQITVFGVFEVPWVSPFCTQVTLCPFHLHQVNAKGFLVALHELRALRDIPLHQSGTQYLVPNHDQTFTAFFKLKRRGEKGRKNIISGIGAQIPILQPNSTSNKEFK